MTSSGNGFSQTPLPDGDTGPGFMLTVVIVTGLLLIGLVFLIGRDNRWW